MDAEGGNDNRQFCQEILPFNGKACRNKASVILEQLGINVCSVCALRRYQQKPRSRFNDQLRPPVNG
jgi:hypothetical protein